MNAHAPSGGAIAVFAAQVVSASPAGSLPRACTHAPAVSSGRARLSSPRRSTCPAGLSRRGNDGRDEAMLVLSTWVCLSKTPC